MRGISALRALRALRLARLVRTGAWACHGIEAANQLPPEAKASVCSKALEVLSISHNVQQLDILPDHLSHRRGMDICQCAFIFTHRRIWEHNKRPSSSHILGQQDGSPESFRPQALPLPRPCFAVQGSQSHMSGRMSWCLHRHCENLETESLA